MSEISAWQCVAAVDRFNRQLIGKGLRDHGSDPYPAVKGFPDPVMGRSLQALSGTVTVNI